MPTCLRQGMKIGKALITRGGEGGAPCGLLAQKAREDAKWSRPGNKGEGYVGGRVHKC